MSMQIIMQMLCCSMRGVNMQKIIRINQKKKKINDSVKKVETKNALGNWICCFLVL